MIDILLAVQTCFNWISLGQHQCLFLFTLYKYNTNTKTFIYTRRHEWYNATKMIQTPPLNHGPSADNRNRHIKTHIIIPQKMNPKHIMNIEINYVCQKACIRMIFDKKISGIMVTMG